MNASDHSSQEPAPLLVDHLSKLPKGLVLDIACGYGRNSFYLSAQEGYQVVGFDQSEEAIGFCNRQAKKRDLPFSARCIDLEKQFPSENEVAVVSCFYYLDRTIIPRIKKALKMGGMIVYETFLIDQHKQFGKPSRQSFCWQHNELLKSFSEFRILYYHEGRIFPSEAYDPKKGSWVAQLIAERIA